VLALDMSSAFNRVSHRRLAHNMRCAGVPPEIVRWMLSFTADRQARLQLGPESTDSMDIHEGIPQGSPVSPILFLLFNADLVRICTESEAQASCVAFSDDLNLITWGKSTRENCDTLSRLHARAMHWARCHGAKFAPGKYKLIHLARQPKKFNLAEPLHLEGLARAPQTELRVLGVLLDSSLTWGPQLRQAAERIHKRVDALGAITSSVWGSTLIQSRLIYCASAPPAALHGAAVWGPNLIEGKRWPKTWKGGKIDQEHFRAARLITGAYRATRRADALYEAALPPIRALIAKAKLSHQARLEESGTQLLIDAAKNKIRRWAAGGPQADRRRRCKPTPGEERRAWALRAWGGKLPDRKREDPAPWEGRLMEPPPNQQGQDHLPAADRRRTAREALEHAWREIDYPEGPTEERLLAPGPHVDHRRITSTVLRRHNGCLRAVSSAITQIRTGAIGLNAFLWRRRVPGIHPRCACGAQSQTVRHVLLSCPNFAVQRRGLWEGIGHTDLGRAAGEPQGARMLATWFIRHRFFAQFHSNRTLAIAGPI
jgi:hypothetical protein